MTVVKVLIGVAGVGKSTYIQKVKTLHERMKEALLSKQYDTIFYDATNLSRKLRKGFYQQFKKYAEIEAVVLVKPLATI